LIAEASAPQLIAEVGARARTRRKGYPFVPIYQGRDALFERPLRGRFMMGRNFQEAVKSRYPRPDLSQTFT
jgi:hypothetical protein